MDIVISSATHRSGSTLLQRIFNAREQTLIWGENGGCLIDFCKINENTKHYAAFNGQRRAFFNNNENPNKWIACMTPPKKEVEEAMIKTVKTFHDHLYAKNYAKQHDLIGYKEVRYGKRELLLLRQCYPECKVLLLIRNPVNVWKSLSPIGMKNLYGSVDDFIKVWNDRVKAYLELSKSDAGMYLVKYEDLINRKQDTLNLLKKVGHLRDKEIGKVLNKKISSTSKPIPKKQETFIRNQCDPLMKALGYS